MEGVYNNAAAPAVREPFSSKWIDIDPSIGISLPGAYGNTDFDNRGEKGNSETVQRTNRFLATNAGLQVQLGPLGLNVLADFLNYEVSSRNGNPVSLTLGRIHAVAAYSFLDNQLVVGGGARIVFVNVAEQSESGGALVRMLGAAPQVGVIVKPNNVPWRLGATLRAPVEASPFPLGPGTSPTGQTTAGPYVLPTKITEPWELEAGVAYQLGPRPLNPAWVDPHEEERAFAYEVEERRHARAERRAQDLARMGEPRTADERAARALHLEVLAREDEDARVEEDRQLREASVRLREERQARYLNWPREHLLLLASMLVTGASEDAVALEGFIDQRREIVGRSVVVAPRFGVESEPIPNLIRGRAGTYLEPSRFSDASHRQHFTFGGDVRLFSWDVFGLLPKVTWRTSAFLDIAPRYQNFGITVGPWH
ncbi:MAG: hypothetical protein JWP97_3692 [Labilithrix sp.]|nr:hypothetical protein [Labilithrix sp.]